MNKAPSIVRVEELEKWNTQREINGRWVKARALGLYTIPHRLHCAWLVLTGRADALLWEEGQ